MESHPEIVTVKQGKLLGQTSKNLDGKTFYSFQGIPYAKPPLGQLRFKASQPPEPWTGIRDAKSEANECISRKLTNRDEVVGSEDCLFLNVFTPQVLLASGCESNSLKPVMVWIHGGGFIMGSSKTELYGPEYLLTEDIVLVTINYRLGIFGFLSLEDPSLGIPGNSGFKDMIMALKWIQENIKSFGGDSNNVTIFGESAGAAAVHNLVLSPMAKGLFHKAIAQSGCALNAWARARNISSDLAKLLHLEDGTEAEILKTLQLLPTDKLFEIANKVHDPLMTQQTFLADQLRAYGWVVEKPSNEEAFLSEEPLDIIKNGKFNHVPFLTGYTTAEGLFLEFFNKPNNLTTLTDFDLTVPYIFNLKPGSDLLKLVANKIKNFYCCDDNYLSNNAEKFYMLQTDNWFFREIYQITKLHALTSSAPVYFYRMSVESMLNLFKNLMGSKEKGVCHADDLGYLFKTFNSPEIKPDSIEDISIRRFVKLWTNFARCGDPNPKSNDDLINVTWKPVTKNEVNFIDIGQTVTTGVNPEAERVAFWEEIQKLVES